jgi:hypothetical protein
LKNFTLPKTEGYCSAGFESTPPAHHQHTFHHPSQIHKPIRGPTNIPILLVKAKKLKAFACVFLVLFSEIMARIVLFHLISGPTWRDEKNGAGREWTTYTTVPANTPAKHLKTIICQTVLLNPKSAVAIETPASEKTRTGFRPSRSAA